MQRREEQSRKRSRKSNLNRVDNPGTASSSTPGIYSLQQQSNIPSRFDSYSSDGWGGQLHPPYAGSSPGSYLPFPPAPPAGPPPPGPPPGPLRQ